jgi:hypothetical protein
MSDVIDASRTLLQTARELDELSKRLLKDELELEQLEIDVAEHVENYHAACWQEHVDSGGDIKLPSEAIRTALAHRSFDRDRYRRYLALRAGRTRRKQRIGDLKEIVAAQRSIVSALKTELEASEGPQPQWSTP